jgi:hypothetical protein
LGGLSEILQMYLTSMEKENELKKEIDVMATGNYTQEEAENKLNEFENQ